MKTLKEYITESVCITESLLDNDLDDKIDDVINFQKLIEKPGYLMDFKDLLSTRYKKYKCKIEKSSPKTWREEVERTIKGFNPNKKYIFIVQNPVDRIKRLCIYINDGDKIHKNYLNGIKTTVKILTKYREESISDFLGFYKSTSIYELPEELEWVYDNIANYKGQDMRDLVESLLDDDLISKVNKKSILVWLLKDILNSKNKGEFYNNRNKLLSIISNNKPSPLTFGNRFKWAGHERGEVWVTKGYFIEFYIVDNEEMGIKIGNMREALYISWSFGRVEINSTYGFKNYSSTIDSTFELPKELVKEYQILYKEYEKPN